MKKTVVLLFLVFLSACGSENAKTLPSEYDASLSITVSQSVYTAQYQKRLDCDRLIFTSPTRLCGLTLEMRDGVTLVTVGDTSFESVNMNRAFDFLPIDGDCTKISGGREYKIEIESTEK